MARHLHLQFNFIDYQRSIPAYQRCAEEKEDTLMKQFREQKLISSRQKHLFKVL